MKRAFLVIALFVHVATLSFAQAIPRPGGLVTSAQPNDARPASISGVVLRAGSTETLRGAQVELIPAEVGTLADYDYNPAILNAIKGRSKSFAVAADSKGVFSFSDVSPGHYRLSAVRDGYNRTEYLQVGANDRGTVIDIPPGAQIADLAIAMSLAPTISGTVVDENGTPAAYASVEALAVQYFPGGVRRLRLVQTADANDLGEFRLYWLSPGDYYVAVEYNDGARHEIFGPVPQARPNVPLPEVSYPTFYYPGTPDLSGAQTIHLAESGDVSGINFRLRRAPLATLRGSVTNLPSAPIKPGEVQILLAATAMADGGFSYRYRPDAQGKFEISGIAPGSYLMRALGRAPNASTNSPTVKVEVSGKDVENIVIPLSSGLTVHGQVQLEGSPGPLPFDTSVVMPQFMGSLGRGESISGMISAGGAYSLSGGGFPGNFQVSFLGLPEGFYLKQVMQGSKDVFASGVQLGGESPLSIDLILGRNTTTVNGTVQSLDAKPSPGAVVVLVPTPEFQSRADRYRRVVTDAQGRFNIVGTPPGIYTAFAFDEILSDAFYNPEFLGRFAGRGVTVTINDIADSKVNPKLIQVDR